MEAKVSVHFTHHFLVNYVVIILLLVALFIAAAAIVKRDSADMRVRALNQLERYGYTALGTFKDCFSVDKHSENLLFRHGPYSATYKIRFVTLDTNRSEQRLFTDIPNGECRLLTTDDFEDEIAAIVAKTHNLYSRFGYEATAEAPTKVT
jgi:hypothetical protein